MAVALAFIAAGTAFASALAAWRSSLLASAGIRPHLAGQIIQTDADADLFIENVGGSVALNAGWFYVSHGELFLGHVPPAGYLRPAERGFVRVHSRHPFSDEAGVIFCRDAQNVIYAWSLGDTRPKRWRPRRWYAPWRPQDLGMEHLFKKWHPGIDWDLVKAPSQWVPDGEVPKTMLELMGGQRRGLGG